MWELTQLIMQTVTLRVVLVIFVEYIRLRRRITHAISLLRIAAREMECDDCRLLILNLRILKRVPLRRRQSGNTSSAIHRDKNKIEPVWLQLWLA